MMHHRAAPIGTNTSRLMNCIARNVRQETYSRVVPAATTYPEPNTRTFSGGSNIDLREIKRNNPQNSQQHHQAQFSTTQIINTATASKKISNVQYQGELVTLQNVEKTFQELDKLVQEQATNQSNPPVITAHAISKALTQWQTWQRQSSKQPQGWTTEAVAAKIWDYQQRLPTVELWFRSSYNTILNGYGVELQQQQKTKEKIALQQAKAFLERVLQHLRQGGLGESPTTKTFETMLRLYVMGRDLQGAMQVLEFLLHNNNQKRDGLNLQIRFQVIIFQDLLQACAKDPIPRNHHRGMIADAFLEKMHQFHQQNLLASKPTTEHYTQVVSAWARSQDPRASQRAMQIWNYLNEQSQGHPRHPLRPDSVLVGAVMNALATTGQIDQAEAFLQELMQKDGLLADRRGINALLFGLAKTKAYNAGEQANQVLRTMQQDWSLKNPALKPDATTYTAVIHAWGMSGHPNGVRKAEELFAEMTTLAETDPNLEPTEETYGCLLHAYAAVGEVTKAMSLLGIVCSNYSSGKNTKVVPNLQMFGILLNAVAKSNQAESGKTAEAFLRQMEQSGIPTLSPDTFTYNIVINAWARSGQEDAGQNAERLLREMQRKSEEGNKNVAPSLITYNAAINAWSKGTESRSPKDAERLLRELMEISKGDDSMKPDKISFHAVMNAYAKEGQPERTESLLAEMKLRGGTCQPDAESLRLCMEAWARSGLECCGEKCDEYIEQLEKLYPNEPPHHLEMRYKSAHIAWMACSKLKNPKAPERLEELSRTLSEIQKMESRPVWYRRKR